MNQANLNDDLSDFGTVLGGDESFTFGELIDEEPARRDAGLGEGLSFRSSHRWQFRSTSGAAMFCFLQVAADLADPLRGPQPDLERNIARGAQRLTSREEYSPLEREWLKLLPR